MISHELFTLAWIPSEYSVTLWSRKWTKRNRRRKKELKYQSTHEHCEWDVTGFSFFLFLLNYPNNELNTSTLSRGYIFLYLIGNEFVFMGSNFEGIENIWFFFLNNQMIYKDTINFKCWTRFDFNRSIIDGQYRSLSMRRSIIKNWCCADDDSFVCLCVCVL